MEITLFQKVQNNLLEKRRNLLDWLNQTPDTKKQIALGPEKERGVEAQVEVLDNAITRAKDHTLGHCALCQDYVEPNLLEMDYTSCVCLDHMSEQERRQLESELEFIQVVQRALLPQQIPAVQGLDMAVFSRPARIVSGDYFDFFQFKDGNNGLVVADAMGHGVSASLIMSSLQSALRMLVPENNSPVEVLKRVNRLFLHNINFTTFVTAFLCSFNPTERLITYVNAGQNPPLVFHKQTNEITWLQPTGAAIGLAESFDLNAGTLAVSEGDILLFYMDGVTEATNRREEAFNRFRLASIVQQNAGLSAQNLLGTVREALNDFIAGQDLADDVTLLACKIEG